jgi:hypothetical protein
LLTFAVKLLNQAIYDFSPYNLNANQYLLISANAKVFLQSILLFGSFRATQRPLELVGYFCRAALALAHKGGMVSLKSLDLDELLVLGCDWLHGYLENSPYVSESDKHLCNGIGTQKKEQLRQQITSALCWLYRGVSSSQAKTYAKSNFAEKRT